VIKHGECPDEPLMTGDDVSTMLQIPKATLYSWTYRNTGPPAKRVGRFLRYERRAVLRWLDEQPTRGGVDMTPTEQDARERP
jgi:predicted DNA-binding transcriptional regulator AlpA